eukprot:220920-Chlamydomonas_euryale.AAC.1
MDNPFVLHMDVSNADRVVAAIKQEMKDHMREEKPKQKIQISAASPEGEVHETTKCSAQRLHPPPTRHTHTQAQSWFPCTFVGLASVQGYSASVCFGHLNQHFFDMVAENSPRASSGIT